MLLKFREWMLQEAVTLQRAAELFGLKPGDVVADAYLSKEFRKLIMQAHADRGGSDIATKELLDARTVLGKFAGRQIPAFQQPRITPQQRWVQPAYDVKTDIRNELTRAITAIKKGQPEDAFAAVSRLVDPYTGKLNTAKPLLKTSLERWLDYYKQGFHDYLEPILVNALKLI